MLNLFKKENPSTPIFVIGTGRSGTHLLGRTFNSNPEVEVFIEDPKFFKPITKLATGIETDKTKLKRVIKKYQKELKKSQFNFVLDKTHPNIWFVEELLASFPNSKFLGISRNVYATVASMLNHRGVMNWYKILPLDRNNNFLGITNDNKDYFYELPIESKCALRWKSHSDRLDHLKESFPNSVLVIDYDEFYNNPNLMIKIQNFIGLQYDLNPEPLKKDGTNKWKNNLTDDQIDNINKVI